MMLILQNGCHPERSFVILSAAKDLPSIVHLEILRCAQDDSHSRSGWQSTPDGKFRRTPVKNSQSPV